MTKILTPISTKNKGLVKTSDKSAKITIAAGMILLGAFFAINPNSLIAFADVDPEEVNFTSNGLGIVHPGQLLVVDKNVTLTQGIVGQVNVTVMPFFEGTTELCVDAQDPPVKVLNLTTANTTTLLDSPSDGFLLYNETFVGMPGVYHCNVVFVAVNVTDSSNTQLIGNQTIWIEAIGSHGYWKNHPSASDAHLPILLGNQTLDGGLNDDATSFNVTTSADVTAIMDAHKGKFDLDKLAGQLLAAKLNAWALMGEGDTSCIDQTIIDADALLEERGYHGIDTGEKLKKSDKFEALSLHSDLDEFNNVGCP